MIRRPFEFTKTRHRPLISLPLMIFVLAAALQYAQAATLPAGFTETQIGGLAGPTAMDFAPDGRLFVCLQGGSLRVIKNGALLSTPFMTLTVDSNGERGLLGIAFDPNFAVNNFLYVYYTVPGSPAHNRVSRFTANGDVVVPGSEVQILNLDNLGSATNHNGGAIHFGPDGKLYVAVGENANGANSQILSNRLGKMLRINSDGTIPSDNPTSFPGITGSTTGLNRAIWAVGLRNPFTFAFQPGTGRMFINDVGQNTWEEINDGIAASNYGWALSEGPTTNPNFRSPLFAYGHGSGATTGFAVTGGTFYNPPVAQFGSSFVGKYFFADNGSGWIRLFDPGTGMATGFASGIGGPVDLKVSSDGSLYYLSIGSSAVFRVQFNGTAPSITQHPGNQTVNIGQPVTFMVTANGSTPLSYQWQRDMVNINGATSANYMIPGAVLTDNGAMFRCVVTNPVGTATSKEGTLTVQEPIPGLQTEAGGDTAIALDSVTLFRDPFPLTNDFNFSADHRNRVMFISTALGFQQGETFTAVTARAEDSQLTIYPLTVEYVGSLPGFPIFSEVILRLPDNIPIGQELLFSITLHGQTSNKVRFRTR